jgi:hypothetical protein
VDLHDGIHPNPRHPTDFCAGKVISGTLATVASRMAKIRADLAGRNPCKSQTSKDYSGGKVFIKVEKCAIK